VGKGGGVWVNIRFRRMIGGGREGWFGRGKVGRTSGNTYGLGGRWGGGGVGVDKALFVEHGLMAGFSGHG